MHVPLFYRSKPIFGLDIGHSAAKIVQIKAGNPAKVAGYGFVEFSDEHIKDGEITDPAEVAKNLRPLLDKLVIGSLNTNRVAASVPIANTFTRILSLPKMDQHDLAEAVRLEAEQYVPLPIGDLYLEHQLLPQNSMDKKESKTTDVLMVAVPKKIVDSYEKLFDILGLENFVIEPSLFAIVRAVEFVSPKDQPRIIIDFGAKSSDLAIYDKTVRFTSTVPTGGEHLTDRIAKTLNLKPQQAQSLKAHHGLNKSRWQKEITEAVNPLLDDLAAEIKKLVRYWQDKAGAEQGISELMVMGGGANLPGLTSHLQKLTEMRVEVCNPWKNLKVAPLQPPHPLEVTLYGTAIGLALTELSDD